MGTPICWAFGVKNQNRNWAISRGSGWDAKRGGRVRASERVARHCEAFLKT